MGRSTTISWTGATWNPWRGCDKVSPGCAHCYMFTQQRAYGNDPSVVIRCTDSTFYAPLRKREWRELKPGTLVFTCSWSDWFHEDADPWRDDAWEVIRQRPDLVFQVLTKRPDRIADHLPPDWGEGWPNVWLGVTIENRRFVDRARVLAGVPAAVRFVSAEPLLGPLAYNDRSADGSYATAGLEDFEVVGDPTIWLDHWADDYEGDQLDLEDVHWIIIGGESGGKARRFDEQWCRDLMRLAWSYGTAVHVKQMGSVWARAHKVRGKAEDPAEWPADLRVRDYPEFELAV